MSQIVSNAQVINFSNQTITQGVVLDLSDIDKISISSTYSPVSSGTGTLAVYESADGQNFIAVSGLTVSITMSGTTIWHLDPYSRYYKILYTASSNGMNLSVTINARNNTSWSNAYVVPAPSTVNS